MISLRVKIIVFSVLLFIVGVIGGYFGGISFYRYRLRRQWSKKGSYTKYFIDKYYKDLDLTPEQKKEIEVILDGQWKAYKDLWEEVKPRYNAMRDSAREEIKRVLDDEQRKKYEEMLRRWREKWKKKEGEKKEESEED